MISVGRLRLRLPSGCEHRAVAISRAVGEVLAEAQVVASARSMESLSLDTVRVAPHASDRQIAEAVARQILASVGEL